jgi:hypothetical protein
MRRGGSWSRSEWAWARVQRRIHDATYQLQFPRSIQRPFSCFPTRARPFSCFSHSRPRIRYRTRAAAPAVSSESKPAARPSCEPSLRAEVEAGAAELPPPPPAELAGAEVGREVLGALDGALPLVEADAPEEVEAAWVKLAGVVTPCAHLRCLATARGPGTHAWADTGRDRRADRLADGGTLRFGLGGA